MEKVILISGKAEHGKDQTAQFLKEILESKLKDVKSETNYKVAVTHYAKHMKDMLYEYYNWNGIKDDWARHKLQWMGTEKIRVGMNMPNFHVNRTCENIDILQEDFDFFIIADCRFPNEIEYVKQYFGEDSVYTVRVHRMNFESRLTEEQRQHPSETSLDDWEDWDYKIVAMGSDLNALHKQCEMIVDKILV